MSEFLLNPFDLSDYNSDEYRQKIIEQSKQSTAFVTKLFSTSRLAFEDDSSESPVTTTSLPPVALNESSESMEQIMATIQSTTLEFDFIADRYTTLAANGNSSAEIPESLGPLAEIMFTTKSKVGWVGGTAMPTGWALLVVLVVMIIFSLPCIRKRGHFEVSCSKVFYLPLPCAHL